MEQTLKDKVSEHRETDEEQRLSWMRVCALSTGQSKTSTTQERRSFFFYDSDEVQSERGFATEDHEITTNSSHKRPTHTSSSHEVVDSILSIGPVSDNMVVGISALVFCCRLDAWDDSRLPSVVQDMSWQCVNRQRLAGTRAATSSWSRQDASNWQKTHTGVPWH